MSTRNFSLLIIDKNAKGIKDRKCRIFTVLWKFAVQALKIEIGLIDIITQKIQWQMEQIPQPQSTNAKTGRRKI